MAEQTNSHDGSVNHRGSERPGRWKGPVSTDNGSHSGSESDGKHDGYGNKNPEDTPGVSGAAVYNEPPRQHEEFQAKINGQYSDRLVEHNTRGYRDAGEVSQQVAPHIKDGFTSFKIEEDQIRNYWPMVKEGVERVISKSNPTSVSYTHLTLPTKRIV